MAIAALGIAVATGAAAQATDEATFPTNEQLRHFRELRDPQLSPDGSRALLQVLESTADGGMSHLWLMNVTGGEPRQLTMPTQDAKTREWSGQWMPDGRSILFLAHRGEHDGLFQLPLDGGEARQLKVAVPPIIELEPADKGDDKAQPPADIEADVAAYSVSPDGKWIALSARDPQTPQEKQREEAKNDALWVDHDRHGTHLYLLDPANGKLTAVAVPPDVEGFAWSPDGARVVVVTKAPNNQSDLGPANSAWLVAVSDPAHPQNLAGLPATIGAVEWSFDGRSLVYLAQSRHETPPGFSDLYEYNLETKATRVFDSGGGDTMSQDLIPLPDGGVARPVVSGFDLLLLAHAADGKRQESIALPMKVVSAVRSNAARNGWLFLGSSGGHPAELHFASTLKGATTKLQTPPVVPEHLRSVAPKRIEWKNEGLKIEGTLYLPPQAATGKVPLVVDVHGGPTGAFVDSYSQLADFLVGHGWAVLRTNPRGSLGRGPAFAAANRNDLGGADYRDIMKGVDFVLKTEPIDGAKMALMGYSYGGEMAAFVVGKTQRFKAIVSGAPVIDQFSEYGTEDESAYDRWFYGRPWEHFADAWRQSPLAYVASAKTPFLLLQGQVDTVDPLGQSQEMYRALRQIGAPVDLVTYPRENHGPLSNAIQGRPTNEPWHGFDARQRIVALFEKAFR